jgi:heavy metal-binding protein
MNDLNSVKNSAAYPLARAGDAREYTCPMHPEIRQDHPGTFPKCRMALEPKRLNPGLSKTECVCSIQDLAFLGLPLQGEHEDPPRRRASASGLRE